MYINIMTSRVSVPYISMYQCINLSMYQCINVKEKKREKERKTKRNLRKTPLTQKRWEENQKPKMASPWRWPSPRQ